MSLALVVVPSPSSTVPKLILLDRDGVINEDVGAPGVIANNQLTLTPKAGKAIGDLKRSGCRVVVVTNQSCVGKGLLKESGLDEIHNTMKELLIEQDSEAVIDHIYYCTSTKEMDDPRMKPNPGMILEAIHDATVSPQDCVLIGDTISDLEAAASAGVPWRILVSTGYGRSIVGRPPLSDGLPRGEEEGVVQVEEDKIDVGDVLASTVLQSSAVPKSIFPFDYTTNLDTAVSLILLNNTKFNYK